MAVDRYTGKYNYYNDYESSRLLHSLPPLRKKCTFYAGDPLCLQWRGSISKNVYVAL